MQNPTRKLLLAAAAVALVALAGCSGTLTGSQQSATINDVHYQLNEDGIGPVLVANYTTNDYATVIIEDAQNDVVISGEVSPNNTQVTLPMGSTRGGTYTVAMQQGGETKSTQNITFSGPAVEIVNTTPTWEANKLTGVNVTVQNSGDLATEIQNASYRAGNKSRTYLRTGRWLPANTTNTFNLSSNQYFHLTINTPGTINGEVQLNTSRTTHTDTFTREFVGPQLEIQDINPQWSGNTLTDVEATIKNTGDMPAPINATLSLNGETLWTSHLPDTLQPGQKGQRTYGSYSVYRVDEIGRYTFRLTISTKYDTASTTFTETIRDVDESTFFSVGSERRNQPNE